MTHELICFCCDLYALLMLSVSALLYYQLTYGLLVHRDEQHHRKRLDEQAWRKCLTELLDGPNWAARRPETFRLPRHYQRNAFRLSLPTLLHQMPHAA